MSIKDTDHQWEKWGKTDPYFGVLTENRYLKKNLSSEDKADFFASGEVYVGHVLNQVRQYIDPDFVPRHAIDFGCGVGRIVIPLSSVAEKVVGIDVSSSMLNEARKNCEERSIDNVAFVESDDELTSLHGTFDFIHSFIVFQHIPVRRGEELLSNLLSHLDDGGVCAVHFTYARPDATKMRKIARWIRATIPFVKEITNIARGKQMDAPEMQMNPYDLNRLSVLMEKNRVLRYYAEYVKHGGGIRGVLLYFQKEIDADGKRSAELNVARGR